MEAIYQSIALYLGRTFKPLGALARPWASLAPLKGLLSLLFFYLAVSLGYIVYFSESFNFGKRIVALHISIVSCLVLVTMVSLGALTRFERIRSSRFARLALALVPATGFSLLVTLYFANYVANSLWGNNVNYDLASQYLFGGGIFQGELQLLPTRAYLAWAACLLAIFSIHLALAGPLFKSLEELFLPGGRLSLFRDRRRALKSAAGVLAGFLLLGFIGFQSTNVESPYRDRVLLREPVVSLFTNRSGLNDFIGYKVRTALEQEAKHSRASYPAGQSFEKRNVVIILVDSLRADHMQTYGYERPTTPFLTGLVKAGRVKQVEIATSACADTNCGVLAVLASRNLRKQIPQSFKLHELLYDQGYKVHFILSGNHHWYDLKSSYGTSFTSYFDGSLSKKFDWNDDRVIFEGLEQAPDFSGEPAFFYFHLMSLHSTGVKHEEHSKYRPAKNWIEFSRGEFDSASVTNYYDNGVIQTDAIIKGIFEGLERKGYLDKSIVLILSDHGEGLGQKDHALYGHVNYLYQESIRIPLLIYDDPQAKYDELKYATQIDVAPTVVDRLGLEAPSCWQGRSLLDPGGSQYSFHQTATSFPSYAVIYRTDRAIYKYLRQHGQGEALYELVSDPGEKHNLIETGDQAIITHMREKLAENLANP